MPDYQNGKIYSIRSYQTDKVYYGSTCQSLSQRLGGHARDYKRYLNGKCPYYVTSFDILQYDDRYIELVENYPCDSKEELQKREGEVIRLADDACNKNVASRTKKEYRQDNKDKILEYQKQYHEDNKDKINEQRSTLINCECGSEVTLSHLARHKKTQKHIQHLGTNNNTIHSC